MDRLLDPPRHLPHLLPHCMSPPTQVLTEKFGKRATKMLTPVMAPIMNADKALSRSTSLMRESISQRFSMGRRDSEAHKLDWNKYALKLACTDDDAGSHRTSPVQPLSLGSRYEDCMIMLRHSKLASASLAHNLTLRLHAATLRTLTGRGAQSMGASYGAGHGHTSFDRPSPRGSAGLGEPPSQ